MKTTRWFIEYNTFTHGWLTSMHNTAEGWESQEAANHWYENVLEKELQHCFRVVSREVEVSAKDVLKVKSTIVELELANAWYRRKEEGESIEWSQYSIEARWSDDRGWVQTYSTHNGKVWREQDEDCYIRDCEEPEVERIWREYNE
jgi:hypothetical protein